MKSFTLNRWFFVSWIAVIAIVAGGCSREAKKSKHFARANKAFDSGRYDVAEVEYMNVLRFEQTNQTALRNLGLMAAEQGRLGRAFSLLTEAKKVDPNDFQVRLKLAQFALASGDAAQARGEALLLLEKNPANEELLLLLGDSSITPAQIKDTEQRLGKLTTAANTVGYHVALGTVRVRNRDFSGAEASFQKALSLDPKSSAAHVALGSFYKLKNKREEAEAAYKKAAELAPPRSPHRLAFADFKLATEDYATAKRSLEEITKQTPDYLPAQMRLAQLALIDRRFTDCEKLIQNILSRDATHLEGMLLLSRLWSAQNETAKEVAVLEKVIKIYPQIPQVHYQMAQAQLKKNNDTGAINSLNQAIKIQPDYAEAIILMAELNTRRGDVTSALNSLKKLIKQHPDSAGAHFVLATAYQSQGNLDEALKVYQALSRLDPKNPQVPLRTGLLLQKQGKNNEARKSYEAALAIVPRYPPALEALLKLDVSESRLSAAKERIEKELKADSKNASLYLLQARVYLAETNLTSAENTLLKAVAIAPDLEEAHALLGHIYVTSNREQEALKKYQEIVARKPDHVASWLQIAHLNEVSKNYTETKNAYEKILAVDAQNIVALNNLAGLYSDHLGDAKKAQDLAGRAWRLQPANPAIADTFGWALYKGGDYPRAMELLKESARKLPDEAQVQFHLGMVHYQVGEEAAAKASFEKVIKLAVPGVWQTEAEARLKVLAINPGTADPKAVGELDGLLARFPNDPIILSRKAALFERTSDWNKAAASYEQVLKSNPNFVPAMVKLAQIYSGHLNDPKRAIELARRARKLEPNDPTIGHILGKLVYDSAVSAAEYQSAFSLLQESAQKLPANPEVLFNFAWASYSIGQWQAAVDSMRRVADAKSPSLSAQAEKFIQMTGLLSQPSEAEANVAKIQEILAAEPTYVPALMAMGVVQETKGEFKSACDNYERALKRFPLFSLATKRLAQVYYGPMRDSSKAYDYATRARGAFPQDAQIAKILGMIEYDRAKYFRAAQLLSESSKNLPTDADVFYRLGMAYYKLKQTRESKQALAKALELAPTSPFATEAKRLLTELN